MVARMMTRQVVAVALLVSAFLLVSTLMYGKNDPRSGPNLEDGRDIYLNACAACHGTDGRGVSRSLVGFDVPLPDFTDCQFARREPDADWVIVAHQGGPIRGFSRFMPAFGKALSDEELLLAVQYIRVFCQNNRWPRGELNLPKALITEKAFPEDELILRAAVGDSGDRISGRMVYEKRLGARNQIEVVIPFGWYRGGDPAGIGETADPWSAGLGDAALGYKRVLIHNHRSSSILSAMGELILPVGDQTSGFGSGHWTFEPFLVFSQGLPADFFLHSQGGLELPLNPEPGEAEAFFRLAVGRSFTTGRFGRTWSPMLGFLGARALSGDEGIQWDLVPQIQITLNQRQHIMFNIGVRIPMNQTADRNPVIIAYLLWDWFDGGFFEGW